MARIEYPEEVNALVGELKRLPGIGPRLKTLVERVAGPRIVDLIWALPTGMSSSTEAGKMFNILVPD